MYCLHGEQIKCIRKTYQQTELYDNSNFYHGQDFQFERIGINCSPYSFLYSRLVATRPRCTWANVHCQVPAWSAVGGYFETELRLQETFASVVGTFRGGWPGPMNYFAKRQSHIWLGSGLIRPPADMLDDVFR